MEKGIKKISESSWPTSKGALHTWIIVWGLFLGGHDSQEIPPHQILRQTGFFLPLTTRRDADPRKSGRAAGLGSGPKGRPWAGTGSVTAHPCHHADAARPHIKLPQSSNSFFRKVTKKWPSPPRQLRPRPKLVSPSIGHSRFLSPAASTFADLGYLPNGLTQP